MKEVIVRLTSDHIKVKGGEYVQDFIRCQDCIHRRLNDYGTTRYYYCTIVGKAIEDTDYCAWNEVRYE